MNRITKYGWIITGILFLLVILYILFVYIYPNAYRDYAFAEMERSGFCMSDKNCITIDLKSGCYQKAHINRYFKYRYNIHYYFLHKLYSFPEYGCINPNWRKGPVTCVNNRCMKQFEEDPKIVKLENSTMTIPNHFVKANIIAYTNFGTVPLFFQINAVDSTVKSLKNLNICSIQEITNNQKQVYLEFKKSPTKVIRNEVVGLPLNIYSANDVEPDTCLFKLHVEYGEDPDNLDQVEIIDLEINIDEK